MKKQTAAFMIAGTSSGVGKTTLSMGIMAALSKEKTVQAYKVGPDYIDPAFHSYITKRPCRNLDSFLMEASMIRYLFEKNLQGAEVAVVEGVMGLFDGAQVGSDVGTSASIAKMLNLPVILVVNGEKVATSIAATVKGFDLFDPDLPIAGVIINNVGSQAHYDLLRRGIEYHTDVKVCGYLLKENKLTLPERHLGLVPACEHGDLDRTFEVLGNMVANTVDLDAILALSSDWEEKKGNETVFSPAVFNDTSLRIGIAKDKAFNFYYQDALDYLEDYGNVIWVPFSPMTDRALPDDLDGLYFGGGFPEVFPQTLKENEAFLSNLRQSLVEGIPYIAECGGLMYLCEELTDLEGESHPMVGWLPGSTTMTKRLQRFGYGDMTLMKDCLLGPKGSQIRIHEFHRSQANVEAPMVYELKKIRDEEVISTWQCGYSKGNGVAAYAHMHFMSNPETGEAFVAACKAYKKSRMG